MKRRSRKGFGHHKMAKSLAANAAYDRKGLEWSL